MTVSFDTARKRWRYDFRYRKERKHGYCIDPKTGAHARNKTEAKAIEDAIRVAVRNDTSYRPAAATGYAIEQCFATYLKTLKNRGGFIHARDHVAEFLRQDAFRPGRLVSEITDQDILDYIEWALDQRVAIWMGGPRSTAAAKRDPRNFKQLDRKRSRASVNRYLDTLRAALKLAHKMRDGQGNRLLPDLIDVPKLKTKKRLPRPMPLSLAQEAIAQAPPHLAAAIELVTEFGFRSGEVFGLQIHQVDVERQGIWLDGDDVKENADAFLPATPGTMALLRRLVDQAQAAGQQHLILYLDPSTKRLRPIKKPRAAWQRLRRILGLQGRHTFHNIRGTFAQRMVRGKVDPRIAQKLMRHSRLEITEMYYEIEAEARRAAVEAIDQRVRHEPPANDNTPRAPDERTGSA